MNAAVWNVVPVLALFALAPAHLSARGTPAPQTVVDQTKEGAEKTKDAVVKGTKTAADKTKDGLSKTGEVMTDGWITTRVHEIMSRGAREDESHVDGCGRDGVRLGKRGDSVRRIAMDSSWRPGASGGRGPGSRCLGRRSAARDRRMASPLFRSSQLA